MNNEELVETVTIFKRVIAINDALPVKFRPVDETPLREILPGVWPSLGELRSLIAIMDAALLDDTIKRRLNETLATFQPKLCHPPLAVHD